MQSMLSAMELTIGSSETHGETLGVKRVTLDSQWAKICAVLLPRLAIHWFKNQKVKKLKIKIKFLQFVWFIKGLIVACY